MQALNAGVFAALPTCVPINEVFFFPPPPRPVQAGARGLPSYVAWRAVPPAVARHDHHRLAPGREHRIKRRRPAADDGRGSGGPARRGLPGRAPKKYESSPEARRCQPAPSPRLAPVAPISEVGGLSAGGRG